MQKSNFNCHCKVAASTAAIPRLVIASRVPWLFFILYFTFLIIPGIALAADPPDAGAAASSAILSEVKDAYNDLILPIAALLTGVMLVWSGIVYASSEGQPEKIAKAKEYTLGAIAGFVLILVCGLIVKAVSP